MLSHFVAQKNFH